MSSGEKIVSSITSPGPVTGENASTSSTSSSSSSWMPLISALRRPAMLVLLLWLPFLPLGVGEDEVFRLGPLKMLFFRFANTKLLEEPLGSQDMPSLNDDTSGWRTTRIFDGKAEVVGVAGSTLTEWCGDRVGMEVLDLDPEAVEDVDEALECV